MKLLIQEYIIELENNDESIDFILEKIKQTMNLEQIGLSHLIVDGIEVYSQYKDYLKDHISLIENVHVVLKPVKELINDLFLSAEDYLRRALPELSILINEFYQDPTKRSWDNFNNFLNGLQWMDQLIWTIDQGKYQPTNWDKYLISVTTIQEELKNLEDAIKVNDHILMADILKYEVLPQLEILKDELGYSIDQEGKRNHVN